MYRPSFKPSAKNTNQDVGPNHGADIYKEYGKTPVEKALGNYKRYFIESIVDGTVGEITRDEYKLELKDTKLYKRYSIDWNAASPSLDVMLNGHIITGSNIKNIQEVLKYPALFEFLAKKDEITVEYLQALPKQFMLKNGNYYEGLYHITKEGIKLTGEVHTSSPHKVLYTPGTRLTEYLPEYHTSTAIQYSRTRKAAYENLING